MPGRIRDEDVALVREQSPIADIIGEQIQLGNAGGGRLKGLCPFHDEKSPSFSVSPTQGLYYCFGCGEGGDVIRFVERIEHVSFGEAVEKLAARAGVTVRYVDAGGASAAPRQHGQRQRLIAASAAAAEFYAGQLGTPEAAPARNFLTGRGFDAAAAAQFGCGFAPGGWETLTRHLLGRGYTPEELVAAGLSRTSQRGSLIDRFHRRLLWPIRDVGGDVVGFGARRIFDDDPIDAKYLNTPETSIYKKSQLLYGLDMAKREIVREHRAVIVEGYTDVMACHLAGVPVAVATCGTAFGSEHVSLLRRMLLDSDAFTGEVIFTFDGDAAGMRAAERAFGDDQKFMAQTFVAVQPEGLDPCELRQRSGDVAVRDLVASRVPLVEFVLRTTVGRVDLDTAEGRSAALDRGVPLVAQIKDYGLRDEYARRLAGLVGIDDPLRVVSRVRGMARTGRDERPPEQPAQKPVDVYVAKVEREVLKVALQYPAVAGPQFAALPDAAFLVPAHASVRRAIEKAGGATGHRSGPAWIDAVAGVLPGEARGLVTALAVEPLHAGPDGAERYAAAMLAAMQRIVLSRQIEFLRRKLQRINPQDEPEEHARLFGELIALQAQERILRDRAIGGA